VRESVIDAATRLIEGCGFKKMTMEAIAHEAGIGKATIYGYFQSKEDVALSVIRRHQEVVRARWHEIAASDLPHDLRVREMLVFMVLAGFDKAQRCRRSMDETLSALRHMILQRRYQFNAELALLLGTVLEQGRSVGVFSCEQATAAAQTLITGVSGLNPTNLSPEELGERAEIEARANRLIDLMLCGLLSRCECVSPHGNGKD
jgi:AcrR family transcriptional regulator